jgi:hypothetical protein
VFSGDLFLLQQHRSELLLKPWFVVFVDELESLNLELEMGVGVLFVLGLHLVILDIV